LLPARGSMFILMVPQKVKTIRRLENDARSSIQHWIINSMKKETEGSIMILYGMKW